MADTGIEFAGTPEDWWKIFECQKCGSCCRNHKSICIDGYDAPLIAHYLGMTEDYFKIKYAGQRAGQYELPTPCPFVTSANTCKIYDHRPRACQIYPIIGYILDGLSVSPFCTYVRQIVKGFCGGTEEYAGKIVKQS